MFHNSKINTSIIVAVYNAEKNLNSVISALVNQNFKNYEIILVDDGSTDNSLSIMKNHESKYPNIIVLQQKNKGAAIARNLGIKHAKGKFIAIVDDDVLLEKNWLKKTIPLLNDERIGFVSSVIKNNRPADMSRLQNILFDYSMTSRRANIRNEGAMPMCNATRREVLNKVGIYSKEFTGSAPGADIELVQRITLEGYQLGRSSAVAIHIEDEKRFFLSFYFKKPLSWSKSLYVLYKKGKFNKLSTVSKIIIFPVPLFYFIISLILSFYNAYFLFLFLPMILGYIYLRGYMIKALLQRKRNIFEILFICLLDIIRVFIYNLGIIKYFFS